MLAAAVHCGHNQILAKTKLWPQPNYGHNLTVATTKLWPQPNSLFTGWSVRCDKRNRFNEASNDKNHNYWTTFVTPALLISDPVRRENRIWVLSDFVENSHRIRKSRVETCTLENIIETNLGQRSSPDVSETETSVASRDSCHTLWDLVAS